MTKYRTALNTIGGLSAPAKMPCHSWSIPAAHCSVGAKLARMPGTTCHGCYALKGQYMFPNVQAAMRRRHEILIRAMSDPCFGEEFVDAFVYVLHHKYATTRRRLKRGLPVAKDGRWFRWHDSGDLQGKRHLRLIQEIARLTPMVRHWLPTREHALVESIADTNNLTIRLSLPRVDQRIEGPYWREMFRRGRALSGVHTTPGLPPLARACPAYQNDGACGDCRACWSPFETFISYPKH